jgi:ABC-type sugar transport system permease subunit
MQERVVSALLKVVSFLVVAITLFSSLVLLGGALAVARNLHRGQGEFDVTGIYVTFLVIPVSSSVVVGLFIWGFALLVQNSKRPAQ